MSAHCGISYHFDHVKGVLDHLSNIALQFGITIDDELKWQAIEDTISHYHDHIQSYDVRVTGIDPYKFGAWAGMYLFRRLDNHNMIAATIACLRRYLLLEHKNLDLTFCKKLLVMAYHDEKKDSVAIGKNGLYMSFRTASELAFIPPQSNNNPSLDPKTA